MTTKQFEARAMRKANILMKDDGKTFSFFVYLINIIIKSGLLQKFIDFLAHTLPLKKTYDDEEED